MAREQDEEEREGRVPEEQEADEEAAADFVPLDDSLEAEIVGAVTKKRKNRRSDSDAAAGASNHAEKPRVLYIAHIPHGFYEDQMAGFFGQFGKITRLRISRNKKTGKSKHYAFLEFESPEVAAIVAECMHNYLLFSSVLQCKLVPDSKLHPQTWLGANKKFRKVPVKKIAREQHNKDRGPEEQQRVLKRLLRSDRKRRSKLASAGIDYDFDSFSTLLPGASRHKKFA